MTSGGKVHLQGMPFHHRGLCLRCASLAYVVQKVSCTQGIALPPARGWFHTGRFPTVSPQVRKINHEVNSQQKRRNKQTNTREYVTKKDTLVVTCSFPRL